MKNNLVIFPSQLTFLTFAYVYGGLAIHGADGIFTVIGCVAAAAASASLGSLAACDGRGIRRAIARLFPRSAETEAAAVLTALCSAPLVADILAFGNYTSKIYSSPVSPSLFSLAALVISIILCFKIKTLGRLAEILVFFSVPCVFVSLFGKFTPSVFFSTGLSGIASWGSIAVPIAVCTQTTASGVGKYHDLTPSTTVLSNANTHLALCASGGAFAGGLFYLFTSCFVFPSENIASTLFSWSAAVLRLSSALFALSALRRGNHPVVLSCVFAVTCIFTLISVARKTLPFVAGAVEMLNIFSLFVVFCFALPTLNHIKQTVQRA